MKIRTDRTSPNHGPRPPGKHPELIVLHYTAMEGGSRPAVDWLCDPVSQVSCHYLIGDRGTVWHMVDEDRRAWHAGVGNWGGDGDVNSRSIGIELANRGETPFGAVQMDALEELLRDLMACYRIPAHGVIGHSCCAPGRKVDPGHRFDWRRLALQGLAVWSDEKGTAPVDEERFRADAYAAGFDAEQPFDTLLQSVRLRHRHGAHGALNGRDMAVIADVARRWPTERQLDREAIAV